MVESYQYIKIRSSDNTLPAGVDPGTFECFQGSTVSVSLTDSGGTGDTGGAAGSIPDAVWLAQTTYIEGEIAYLTQLNEEWKNTVEHLETDSTLNNLFEFFENVLQEIFEEAVTKGIAYIIAAAGITLTTGASAFVGVAVAVATSLGFEKMKEAFVGWLKEGNKLLEAMTAENNALLQAEQSLTAYTYRNDVITRHERTIYRLLDELDKYRQTAEQIIGTPTVPSNTDKLEQILTDALLTPKLDSNGNAMTDNEGNIIYEGVLDPRLEDLAYNEDSFRVGDVEINTRGRYVKH